MQKRRVRQHCARYASADLAPKPQGRQVAAARDRKVASTMVPLSLAAVAPDDEQAVAIMQFPECQVVQYVSHAWNIPMGGRTIQEQTEAMNMPPFPSRLGLAPQTRHKLKNPHADFGGFLRVSAGGRFVANPISRTDYVKEIGCKSLILNGAPGRIRTCDLRLRKPSNIQTYQCSSDYSPQICHRYFSAIGSSKSDLNGGSVTVRSHV